MAEFRYLTTSEQGGLVWKSASAASAASLERELLRAEILVLDLQSAEERERKERSVVRDEEKLLFLEQLETAFYAGIPLTRALAIGVDGLREGALRRALMQAREDVANGMSFSGAVERWPGVFSEMEGALLGAGETAGIMAQSLKQMNVSLRRAIELRRKMGSLLLYPKIVALVLVVVLAVLLGFTLPRFEGIFVNANVELPWATKILLATSRWAGGHPLVVCAAVCAAMMGVYAAPFLVRAVPWGHRLLFLVPLFGALMRRSLACNFCRTFSQLLAADVPMLTALRHCREISWNTFYRRCVAEVCLRLNAGRPFADAMDVLRPILGAEVISMLEFGEKSGSLSTILTPLRERMDHDLDLFVERLKPAMESAVTVGISVFIGAIVIAAVLPIFDMVKVFSV